MIGKGAVAISNQHSPGADLHVKAAAALNVVEVVFAVAIEVGPGNFCDEILVFAGLRLLAKPAGDLLRQDPADAVTETYVHGIHRGIAGSSDIRIAVAIEIAHGD